MWPNYGTLPAISWTAEGNYKKLSQYTYIRRDSERLRFEPSNFRKHVRSVTAPVNLLGDMSDATRHNWNGT